MRRIGERVERRILAEIYQCVVVGHDIKPVVCPAHIARRLHKTDLRVRIELEGGFVHVVALPLVQIPECHVAAREHDIGAVGKIVVHRAVIARRIGFAYHDIAVELDVNVAARGVDHDFVKGGKVDFPLRIALEPYAFLNRQGSAAHAQGV